MTAAASVEKRVDTLHRAAALLRGPLTAEQLRALPIGSAVITSGRIVYVKYGNEKIDTLFEWGSCSKVGGSFYDSDRLAKTDPRLLYRYVYNEPDCLDADADLLEQFARLDDQGIHPPTSVVTLAKRYLGEAS